MVGQKDKNIVELGNFNELEEKIKKLAEEYVLLRERNSELEGLLQTRDEELGEAKHQIGILKEERNTARTKVDSMLALLSDIKVP